MDKMYILGAIERISNERAKHDQKFAHNPVHKDCLPRFDRTIEMLQAELAKLESLSGTRVENESKN